MYHFDSRFLRDVGQEKLKYQTKDHFIREVGRIESIFRDYRIVPLWIKVCPFGRNSRYISSPRACDP